MSDVIKCEHPDLKKTPSRTSGFGMSDVLKPCPFCGDTPEYTSMKKQHVIHRDNGCVLSDMSFSTKDWNTRHQDEALKKSHAELVSNLKAVLDGLQEDGHFDKNPCPTSIHGKAKKALSNADKLNEVKK